MMWRNVLILFSVVFIVKFLQIVHTVALFPRYSVLQITAAFSVPVEIPKRKLFFDLGFQFNYDLPFNLSNFYNIPIWPRNNNKRSIDQHKIVHKYVGHNETINHYDLTAGELYTNIEDLIISFGYHETCLLKTICDIARHPFDISDDQDNLLAEIITFVMTPSLHQAFADNEIHYKNAYEMAEFYGRTENDCNIIYADCNNGLLDDITKIIFEN